MMSIARIYTQCKQAAAAARGARRAVYAYQRTGELAILEEAIVHWRVAVASIPVDHPRRPVYLTNLGNTLRMLFERTGETAVLAEAAQTARSAVAAAPTSPAYLTNLGLALRALSEHTGEAAILTEAVQAARAAAAAAPPGYPDRAGVLSNLGMVLHTQFEQLGQAAVLAEEVQATRDAVAAAGDAHPYRGKYLNNLGIALRSLAEHTGEISKLPEAVQAFRAAVAAPATEHSDRLIYLLNLSTGLQVLFEQTGDAGTLADAVQVSRDAAAAVPFSHPDRPFYLSNLATTLRLLFERTGDAGVLADAVRAGRDAVTAAPVGHANRSKCLSALGSALVLLYERTGETIALEEGVQASRDAVAAIPASHAYRPMFLANVASALQALGQHTGQTAPLEEAVRAAQDAVAGVATDHPGRPVFLSSLANALRALYLMGGETPVLAEAVRAARDAVAAAPATHPRRPALLNGLGGLLQVRFADTGDPAAAAEASQCFVMVAHDTGAPAAARVAAYRAIARISWQVGGSPQEALEAVQAAVGLLPQIAPRSLVRADREHSLGQLRSLAGEAAAAAAASGLPGRAVELLEQARGVLVADTLDARSSDLSRLRSRQPGLADEFGKLRAHLTDLDQAGTTTLTSTSPRYAAAEIGASRRDAHAAWDSLIARIRATDGFADFLQSPGIRQLTSSTSGTPIVLVYASAARCDALILTGEAAAPVRLVPLPDLTEDDAYDQVNRLLDALQVIHDPDAERGAQTIAEAGILAVLGWLWDAVTWPILAALGHTRPPAGSHPWPRVWWCPVGILTYLPLHAAGHHCAQPETAGPEHPRTVLDLAVSSYVITVRGLAYARAQRPDPAVDTTLIIAAADTLGTSPLPGVRAEAAFLAEAIPGVQTLAYPTREAVLDALPSHRVAHFACHGYADWGDPAASQLLLHNHRSAPLTVTDISALHLTGGLAYLSACDTSSAPPELANEAVHLTGAFHLAGYQHVIGTLWPVNDPAARRLASDFYRHLTRHGAVPPDPSQAAAALHHAARRLRDRFPRVPSVWAAYTHTGT